MTTKQRENFIETDEIDNINGELEATTENNETTSNEESKEVHNNHKDEEAVSPSADIDAIFSIFDRAKKEKEDEENARRLETKHQAENALAAKNAESEKAEQAEAARKTAEGKRIRKRMKRIATAMLFAICVMSAVFGYVVTGILVHIIFNPKVWIFVGVMGIFGMINTLFHTYMYRYIREEVYRK